MNELLRRFQKSPGLVIGTAAVIGLALGTGVVPIPALGRLSLARPVAPPAAAPAAPPPPPDPLDSY